jgi:hypothetical protein
VRRDTLLRGGQNQKTGSAADPLLRGARRSTACRRWAAKRPQNLTTSVSSDTPGTPVCCRCAPDREQAALLRPPARSKSGQRHISASASGQHQNARHWKSASAEGVGALRGYEGSDGLQSGPNSRRLGLPDAPRAPVLLPVPGRSRASYAPTASGQKQKRAAPHIRLSLRPASKRAALEIRFCRRRRSSSRLREQRWAAQRPQTPRPWFRQTHRVHRFCCRCPADREQAALLRPPARSKSGQRHISASASGQHQNARHRKSASAEGVGALRGYESSDGLRSGPRPHDLGFFRHTACTGFAAGTRQIASKLRSYGLRPESKAGSATYPPQPPARSKSAPPLKHPPFMPTTCQKRLISVSES